MLDVWGCSGEVGLKNRKGTCLLTCFLLRAHSGNLGEEYERSDGVGERSHGLAVSWAVLVQQQLETIILSSLL